MSEESISAVTKRVNGLQRTPDFLQTRLELMRQLQASFLGSRNALLALDLAAIEQGTREQVELSLMLAEDIELRSRSVAKITSLTERGASGFAMRAPAVEPKLREELRRAECGVLQALRLQSALLVRARCKLRVLSNILAGSSVNYGPPWTRRDTLPPVFDFKAGGEI